MKIFHTEMFKIAAIEHSQMKRMPNFTQTNVLIRRLEEAGLDPHRVRNLVFRYTVSMETFNRFVDQYFQYYTDEEKRIEARKNAEKFLEIYEESKNVIQNILKGFMSQYLTEQGEEGRQALMDTIEYQEFDAWNKAKQKANLSQRKKPQII